MRNRLLDQRRGLSELVIEHHAKYLDEYRRDARPLLGSTTFDLSSVLLARSDRLATARAADHEPIRD